MGSHVLKLKCLIDVRKSVSVEYKLNPHQCQFHRQDYCKYFCTMRSAGIAFLAVIATAIVVAGSIKVRYDGYKVYRVTPINQEHLSILKVLDNERVRRIFIFKKSLFTICPFMKSDSPNIFFGS